MNCELHRFHRPAFRTTEEHHVVPQAWQRFWSPTRGLSAFIGIDAAAATLWHPQTVECCPTGHRNVHFWLVRFMKEGEGESTPRVKRPSSEQACALSAMSIWLEAGGSLGLLRSVKQYGYA